MSAAEKLVQAIEAMGWRGVVVPYARRTEAIEQVVCRHERGELDEKLYREYLAPMLEEPVPESPAPSSIVLIATPSLPVRMQFTLDGKPFTVTTAPGYLCGPKRKPLDVVQEALTPFGFSAARIEGPQKAMATLSGFARYGRHNISYVPGLGTFHALATLASDLPCDGVTSGRRFEPEKPTVTRKRSSRPPTARIRGRSASTRGPTAAPSWLRRWTSRPRRAESGSETAIRNARRWTSTAPRRFPISSGRATPTPDSPSFSSCARGRESTPSSTAIPTATVAKISASSE